jgi:hypothetical protein
LEIRRISFRKRRFAIVVASSRDVEPGKGKPMTWLAGHILRNRIWQLPFGSRQRAESRASEIKHPVKTDFHTVVSKAGVNVTFKPTNSIYNFVTDTPVTARLGEFSFLGVEHVGRNTEVYDSDEVRDMALQIASEHPPVNFGHFTS